MNNKTTIINAPKDIDHPYGMLSACIYKLPGNEFVIMAHLLNNDPTWIINKIEIQQRCCHGENGMSIIKFNRAWKSLEDKHHIYCDRFFGGVKWVIKEDPNMNMQLYDQSTTDTSISNTGGVLTNINKTINKTRDTQDSSRASEDSEPPKKKLDLSFDLSNNVEMNMDFNFTEDELSN